MEFPWNYMPHNEMAIFLIWIIEAWSSFKEVAKIDTTFHTTVGAFDATRTSLEFGAHMRNTNSAARMFSFSERPSEAMWLSVDIMEAQYMGKLGIWLVIASESNINQV
ncbi:hypothetical protein RchiOBHm_Chr6g0244351 [Rosa chinensis]|uniref:Uncharacterized protein n=1 Tax=Rosa chinensis TaxID=74649 RepID=A0A2P6PIY7_ROSCH|nr:hypothetical protein RchiOBHm_Chr6g0244351 [Rosa chinensis]